MPIILEGSGLLYVEKHSTKVVPFCVQKAEMSCGKKRGLILLLLCSCRYMALLVKAVLNNF